MVVALWQHVNPMCYGVCCRVYGTGEVGNLSNFLFLYVLCMKDLGGYGFGCPLYN